MTNAEHDEYLTPGQAAGVFHVSSKTVTRWAVQGLLPSLVTRGGHRRFRGEDVDEVLRRMAGDGPAPSRHGRAGTNRPTDDAGPLSVIPALGSEPDPVP